MLEPLVTQRFEAGDMLFYDATQGVVEIEACFGRITLNGVESRSPITLDEKLTLTIEQSIHEAVILRLQDCTAQRIDSGTKIYINTEVSGRYRHNGEFFVLDETLDMYEDYIEANFNSLVDLLSDFI